METSENIDNLVKEKHDLIRRLDNKDFGNKRKKKEFEDRIGEINLEIKKLTREEIEEALDGVSDAVKSFKLESIRDVRKLRKVKRNIYKDMAKETHNLYKKLVKKKKIGVKLAKRLKSKNLDDFDFKETVSLVRRY